MLTGESLKYLLCVLNSKLAQWYFEKISITSGMGTNRWLKYKVEQLPAVEPIEPLQKKAEYIVDKILAARKLEEDANTLKWEVQLDILIYHLYKLTLEEARVIDPGLIREDFEKHRLDKQTGT